MFRTCSLYWSMIHLLKGFPRTDSYSKKFRTVFRYEGLHWIFDKLKISLCTYNNPTIQCILTNVSTWNFVITRYYGTACFHSPHEAGKMMKQIKSRNLFNAVCHCFGNRLVRWKKFLHTMLCVEELNWKYQIRALLLRNITVRRFRRASCQYAQE